MKWCHSIIAVSSSAGSVSLFSLQRAAQAYTSFKDMSWAHSQHPCNPAHTSMHMIIKKIKTQPPRMWNSLGSSDVFTKPRVILDEMDCYLQILPWFTLQHSDSIFTAMQGDPDITHNAQRQTASSPHPFRQSLCRKGWGREKRCVGVERERYGGGHGWYKLLPLRNSLSICISGNICVLLF